MHSWWQSLAVVARDSGEMVPVLRFPPQRSFFLIFLIQSSPSSQGREAHTPQFRRPSEITAIIYDKPCLFEERVSSKHIQNGWKERKHCERQVWKENRIIKQIKAKVRTSTFQQHPSSQPPACTLWPFLIISMMSLIIIDREGKFTSISENLKSAPK